MRFPTVFTLILATALGTSSASAELVREGPLRIPGLASQFPSWIYLDTSFVDGEATFIVSAEVDLSALQENGQEDLGNILSVAGIEVDVCGDPALAISDLSLEPQATENGRAAVAGLCFEVNGCLAGYPVPPAVPICIAFWPAIDRVRGTIALEARVTEIDFLPEPILNWVNGYFVPVFEDMRWRFPDVDHFEWHLTDVFLRDHEGGLWLIVSGEVRVHEGELDDLIRGCCFGEDWLDRTVRLIELNYTLDEVSPD